MARGSRRRAHADVVGTVTQGVANEVAVRNLVLLQVTSFETHGVRMLDAQLDVLLNIENVYGSMHNDEITGDIGENMLWGNEGRDMLSGNAGDDTLHGGMGDDELMGGSGNDMLMGGMGDDLLMGGMGDDTIDGGMGADVIDGGDGTDWIRYAESATGVTVDLGGVGVGGKAEGDSWSNIEGVIGSHMADRLTLGSDGGMLLGYMGNDSLYGGTGDATLGGGKGDDVLDAGAGSNTLVGGMGADTFILWTGVGEVTNRVKFVAGDMIKFGAASEGVPEKLSSEQVDAILDSVTTVTDGFSYKHGDVTVITPIQLSESSFYAAGDPPPPTGSLNQVNLDNEDNVWPGAGDDNSEADHIRGHGGEDELYAGRGDDVVDAGADADMAYGGAGDDTLYGGSGNDMLHGDDQDDEGVATLPEEAGNDWLYGGAGNDTINGNEGHDRLYGEANHDVLNGDDGRDLLDGGAGDDSLYGGNGRDIVDGGEGIDTLFGGSGNDIIRANKGDIVDGDGLNRSTIVEGASEDDPAGTSDMVSYAGTSDKVNVTLDAPTGSTTAGEENVANVEHATGSSGDDTLTGGTNANEIDGGAGNDSLLGEAGNDTIMGGDGVDRIDGGTEIDRLTGGSGNDTFVWGDGDVITDFQVRSDTIDHTTDTGVVQQVYELTAWDMDDTDASTNGTQVTAGTEHMYLEDVVPSMLQDVDIIS